MDKIRFTISNRQKKTPVTPELRKVMRDGMRTTLCYEGFSGSAEVTAYLVDDEAIHAVNREYRNIDAATDVLSFPLGEDGNYDVNPETGCVMLGEMFISMEHAVAQAAEYGHSVEREVGFLTVHSLLHMLGYDHERSKEEEADMFRRQEEILEAMGLPRCPQ